LRLASLYDATWDFTLYGEGFLALIGDTTRYISVDRLINHPTLDPDYVSVKEYISETLSGKSFESEKITPPVLVDMLEKDCQKALGLVDKIDVANNSSLMYEIADIKAWSYLGLHLAEKLKGALALETYRRAGGDQNKQEAIDYLETALKYWDEVIAITRPIYKDMPLTHYNHGSHDRNDDNLFHWALIRDEVANDIEIAKKAVINP